MWGVEPIVAPSRAGASSSSLTITGAPHAKSTLQDSPVPPAAHRRLRRRAHDRSVGRESHTGRYTLDHVTCTVPVDATNSSFTGEFTKTAANGDLLVGTFQGAARLVQPPGESSPIGIFAIEGTITFTGGTGRFEGATGSQRMQGTQSTDFSQPPSLPSRMALEFDGTISSVGSRN